MLHYIHCTVVNKLEDITWFYPQNLSPNLPLLTGLVASLVSYTLTFPDSDIEPIDQFPLLHASVFTNHKQ